MKLTLKNLLGQFGSVDLLNTNFSDIETELQDKVLYRNNPDGEPNQMENDLDMNSNDILNTNQINTDQLILDGQTVTPDTTLEDIGSADVTTSTGTQELEVALDDEQRLNYSVDSVSTLRASSFPANLERLWLSGYYGVGTPGGGELYADRADTTTADNGGTVFVDSDGVRWKRPNTAYLHVDEFGAKGDGSTDDTSAIQAALDHADGLDNNAVVRIAARKYMASGLNQNNASFVGEGTSKTIISKNADNILLTCDGGLNDTKGIGFDSDIADTTDGIYLKNAQRWTFEVSINNMGGHGMVHERGNLCKFDFVQCVNNAKIGFYAKATSGSGGKNACKYGLMDLRENDEGFVLEAKNGADSADNSLSNYGGPIVTQSNVNAGHRIETRSNYLELYSENNGAQSIFQTAGCFCNHVLVFGAATDNGDRNNIYSQTGTTKAYFWQNFHMQKATFRDVSIDGQLEIQHSSDRTFDISIGGASNAKNLNLVDSDNPTDGMNLRVSGNIFSREHLPQNDNQHSLGTGSDRWSEVFAATGTINTSDSSEKQQIAPIDDALLDAWSDVEWVQYKWSQAVEDKGEDARVHAGLIAQQVKGAMESHGLDPFRYGLLCWDEWEDENGEVHSRYGVRYNEAQAVEAAWVRRKLNSM